MTGAGWYPAAWIDLAGLDETMSPSDPRRVTKPVAAYYDGASRRFSFDDDGRIVGIHPVDQGVALALLVAYGRMTSAPTAGNKVRRIRFAGGPRLETEVQTYCREAVQRWVDAGDIRELSIVVKIPIPGSLIVEYSYVRLKDSGNRKSGVTGTVKLGA